jgi:hypothetical protein
MKPINIEEGRVLRILFQYPDKRKAPHQSHVTCKITERVVGEDGSIVSRVAGIGVAKCMEGDTFNKELGRKLALARAAVGFPREARKALWAAYWGRKEK